MKFPHFFKTASVALTLLASLSAQAKFGRQNALPVTAHKAIFFDDQAELVFDQPKVKGQLIRYTVNGTEPNTESPAYSRPIRLIDSADVTAALFTIDGLKSQSITIPCRLKASVAKVDSSNLEPGLFTVYVKGSWSTVPTINSLSAEKTFTSKKIALPKELLGQDQFALAYEGYIKLPQTGEYSFHLASDDGSKLSIDKLQIIDNDGLHSDKKIKTASVELSKGLHAINISYFEKGHDENLKLTLTGGGLINQPIPASWLFHKKGQKSLQTPKVTTSLKGQSSDLNWMIDNDFSTSTALKDVKKGDTITITYPEPIAFNTLTFFTGSGFIKRAKKASLQVSTDGINFVDYVPFYGGVAFKTSPVQQKAKALRVLFHEDAASVDMNELQLHQKALSEKYLKSCVVNIDSSDAPEMYDWLVKASTIAEKSYTRIIENLPTKNFYLHRHVTFTVHSELSALAYAEWEKGIVRINAHWLKDHPEDTGLAIHEMAHIIQRYEINKSWITEGIADYCRYWLFLDQGEKIPTVFRDTVNYKNGYADATHFLVWMQDTYDKDLIVKLNRHSRLNDFPKDVFVKYTGKNLEALWKEFNDSYMKDKPTLDEYKAQEKAKGKVSLLIPNKENSPCENCKNQKITQI